MAKPMKTLELHYPMIQFLKIENMEVCLISQRFSFPFQAAPSERTIVFTTIYNFLGCLCHRCGDFCYKHLAVEDVC